MFDLSSPQDGSKFLEIVASNIDLNALLDLAQEGGFTDPNNFSFDRILSVLIDRRFPSDDHYEYEWAIYECGIAPISGCSSWAKLFVCALYIYCNKVRQWGLSVESDYFYLVIEDELKRGVSERSRAFLLFLEWLHKHVQADEGYDNYFLLLSWLLLRRILGETTDASFFDVVNAMREKNYSSQQIDELNVGIKHTNDWLALNSIIPDADNIAAEEFKVFICGSAI